MTVSTLAPRARRRMQAPSPPHPVTQYALDVVAGRIVAGELVRKACERHLTDLSNDRGLWFDEAAATKAISFAGLFRHYKGDLAKEDGGKGAFIRWQAWQAFVIGAAFGWKRADGLRRFRSVYLEVAKKNGKTLMGAVIALLLTFFDGEPGAEFYSIATKEAQAKLSWNDGARLVQRSTAAIKARIREGGATDDTMLVLIYTLDEGDDPFDAAVWPKANPNLGVSVNVDTLCEQAEKARRGPGKLP